MNKKNVLLEVIIVLSCSILVAIGDAFYRHFGKGLAISDAFRQELIEDGTLFFLIAIVFIVAVFIYAVSRMIARKKDKLDKGNSNDKI